MKLEYVKPELEEIELILEGSFTDAKSGILNPDKPGNGDGDYEGDEWG